MRAFALLLCLVAASAVACSSTSPKPELRDAPIASLEVVSVDGMPSAYEVHIVAQIPGSSCHRPQEPVLERDGTTFHVTIQNLYTGAEVCTADLGFREHAIALPGEFEAGTHYAVLVNGDQTLTFQAQ